MPYTDKDEKRAYAREYMRKRRLDPSFRALQNERNLKFMQGYYAEKRVEPEFMRKVRERTKLQNKRYYADPAKRGRMLSASRAWKKRNPGVVNSLNRSRTAKQLSATPKWANLALIESFYLEAAQLTLETGIAHEVDHVIPLVSKVVCGLHVESNLRVITQSENRSKGNRLE